MDITIIERLYFEGSGYLTETAAISGCHKDVKGWCVRRTLRDGESILVWHTVWPYIFIWWPIRVTNLGDGQYRVSRPWPWIFGEGSKLRVVLPATTHSTTRTCEYATVG